MTAINVKTKLIAITMLPLDVSENCKTACKYLNLTEKDLPSIVNGEEYEMGEAYLAYVTIELDQPVMNINTNFQASVEGVLQWHNVKSTADAGYVLVDKRLDPIYKPRYWDMDEHGEWQEFSYLELAMNRNWLLRL